MKICLLLGFHSQLTLQVQIQNVPHILDLELYYSHQAHSYNAFHINSYIANIIIIYFIYCTCITRLLFY